MASLTVRNLDENVKRELRKRAAESGVSMEQEARDRLAESVECCRAARRLPSADVERMLDRADEVGRPQKPELARRGTKGGRPA